MKLTITLSENGSKMSGEIELDKVNELYELHGINGMTSLVHALLREMKTDATFSVPDDLTVLPPGREW